MSAIGTIGSVLVWPAPPAVGLPPDGGLTFGDLSALLAWGLCGLLAIGALALLAQWEGLRRGSRFRKRLPVVRNVALPRSRAGGTSGRVPPRPAAGSPFSRS